MTTALPILAAVALAGSATAVIAADTLAPAPQGSIAYTCANRQKMTVVYSDKSATVTSKRSSKVVLVRQHSKEGFVYEDPTESIHGQGDGSTISYSIGAVPPTRCKASAK